MKLSLAPLSATSSLGFRLASTLVLALLPLGLLSIVQVWASLDQADKATLSGIGGSSIEAVRPQMDMIRDARTTARMLAAGLSAVPSPGADCVARMRAGAATNRSKDGAIVRRSSGAFASCTHSPRTSSDCPRQSRCSMTGRR